MPTPKKIKGSGGWPGLTASTLCVKCGHTMREGSGVRLAARTTYNGRRGWICSFCAPMEPGDTMTAPLGTTADGRIVEIE